MNKIHGPTPPTDPNILLDQGTLFSSTRTHSSAPAPGPMCTSPNNNHRNYDTEELKCIREKFDWTKSLPDRMINRMDFQSLVKLGNKPAKTDLTKQGLKDLLSANSEYLKKPQHQGSHVDDSEHLLCPVRLDRYPRTSISDFMAAAKQILKPGGVKPTKDYDMEFFGLSGSITDRGWYEIHNPGSEMMNLKMFSRANSGVASDSSRASFSLLHSGEGVGITESLVEISSMVDFKEALRCYITASYMAVPWYPAPIALLNFLETNNYFKSLFPEKELASVLTKFTNETMHKNAKAWQSHNSPPLSAESLLLSWHFFLSRNTSVNSSIFSPQTPLRTSVDGYTKPAYQKNPQQERAYTIPKLFPQKTNDQEFKKAANLGICFRYNLGRCPKQADQSCKVTPRDGDPVQTLKHVCLKCGKKHPEKDHK